MLRIFLYFIVGLAIFTIAKGFWTGEMSGKTTLHEVGEAMENYKGNIASSISGGKN